MVLIQILPSQKREAVNSVATKSVEPPKLAAFEKRRAAISLGMSWLGCRVSAICSLWDVLSIWHKKLSKGKAASEEVPGITGVEGRQYLAANRVCLPQKTPSMKPCPVSHCTFLQPFSYQRHKTNDSCIFCFTGNPRIPCVPTQPLSSVLNPEHGKLPGHQPDRLRRLQLVSGAPAGRRLEMVGAINAIYHSPYCKDPQEGTPNFGKLPDINTKSIPFVKNTCLPYIAFEALSMCVFWTARAPLLGGQS